MTRFALRIMLYTFIAMCAQVVLDTHVQTWRWSVFIFVIVVGFSAVDDFIDYIIRKDKEDDERRRRINR